MNESSKPMYERIFEALREDIIEKKYEPGDRVPSEKELGDEYNVSRITSKKALELLASEGYIVRQPGRGSFVSEQPAPQAKQAVQAAGAPAQRSRKEDGRLLIGLVITDFADSYGNGLIYGMEEASRQHNCYLVLRRTFGIPALEEEAIKGLLELGVDGLIIFPAQGEYFNAEILKLVINQFPFVLVDRHLKGISASSIATDNVGAAKDGTNHLFKLGHKSIAFLTPPPVDTTAIEERIEGFIQAHAEKGIVVDREIWMENITSTLPKHNTEENKQKDIQKIIDHLNKHTHITALFATEFNIGQIAFQAVQQMGKSVPEDYSIVCFDCPETNGRYPFTHLSQNQHEMGRVAFENVLKLHGGQSVPSKILLDASLVISDSTGPVNL
ncbi:DNA-binding transcriptional regulator, LacI/PurR family [Paenibacillus catalpae]|uniref:DNA-binding transcriptional regulator, LacI/PurR family n=1 Tax=Paenibacillus catalpae TaxID=1045775 RepID=A0A1I1XUB1_9BACL|nr:GntR family transcriptional regulator [Paenibacillus catalpae]SFE10841.1 DNA-binding transcriptional regulator, LacI/PurR family [Paenibacillus catalpae]